MAKRSKMATGGEGMGSKPARQGPGGVSPRLIGAIKGAGRMAAEEAAMAAMPASRIFKFIPQNLFRHHNGFMKLRLSDLADVKHGNTINPKQLSNLKESIEEKGFKPSKSDGPVMLRVGEDGSAKITEGNHRVRALKDLAKEGKIKPDQPIDVYVGYNPDLFYAGKKAWVPASKAAKDSAKRKQAVRKAAEAKADK